MLYKLDVLSPTMYFAVFLQGVIHWVAFCSYFTLLCTFNTGVTLCTSLSLFLGLLPSLLSKVLLELYYRMLIHWALCTQNSLKPWEILWYLGRSKCRSVLSYAQLINWKYVMFIPCWLTGNLIAMVLNLSIVKSCHLLTEVRLNRYLVAIQLERQAFT